MSRESNDVGFCCLAHFLTSSKLTVALSQQRLKSENVFCLGSLASLYLRKSYACVNYVCTEDRRFLEELDADYSQVLPQTHETERLKEDEFDRKYAHATLLPLVLKDSDDLRELTKVVKRNLDMYGYKLERRTDQDLSSDSEGEETNRPNDTKTEDAFHDMWIFCIDMEWHKITGVQEFSPDMRYKIVQLADDNLIRAHWDDCKPLLSTCVTQPEFKPIVTPEEILECQNYVYRCLDGYFEYFYSKNTQGALFPFKNSDHARGKTLQSPDCAGLRSGIAQSVSSGQASLPCDVEAGYSMLDRIFDWTDSEQEIDEIQEIPRPSPPSTTPNLLYLAMSSKPRCMVPDSNGMFQSGVRGVNWTRLRRSWDVSVTLGRSSGATKIRKNITAASLDPKDVEIACDIAINVLLDIKMKENKTVKTTPSGVAGVYWHRSLEAWTAVFRGKHLGYVKPKSQSSSDVEEARKKAIYILATYKSSQGLTTKIHNSTRKKQK